MKFFDTTPTARILNRFSKDMDEGTVRKLCFTFMGHLLRFSPGRIRDTGKQYDL